MVDKFNIDKDDLKIRKTWKIDPSEKVHKVKSDYKRNSNKEAIESALEEMEEDLNDL